MEELKDTLHQISGELSEISESIKDGSYLKIQDHLKQMNDLINSRPINLTKKLKVINQKLMLYQGEWTIDLVMNDIYITFDNENEMIGLSDEINKHGYAIVNNGDIFDYNDDVIKLNYRCHHNDISRIHYNNNMCIVAVNDVGHKDYHSDSESSSD